ncbi:FadR/GntR family transcriptional regulator [Pseudonocardia sp. H11422]|uniref:FadR/GntR family transcriptional regulator n=1 Tax=Pseudonocardia sp. H11422 TaxID=2835866 RepID=UPI001BDD4708|nr:FCD domain-containing protein [Pseudonocardia sp. H11422]
MSAASSARTSRAQQVAGRIENDMLAARTPVGTSLGRRADLMREHNISPTVMNEVLRILRDRGLVEVRPGARGGIFVASQPPQVRLGALDLWFSGTGVDPLELFEARTHLEDLLTRVAVDRAGPEDVRDMEWALDEMRRATDARGYLEANMRLHRAIARASRVSVLADMYEAIATLLSASLTRAVMLEGTEELTRHNIAVHREIVSAIRDRNRQALDKAIHLHRQDLIQVTDPTRSPVSEED